MKVYLDNAATTPIDKEVLDAMMPYFTEHYGNPSSIHSYGRKCKAAIEESRKKVANFLNASSSEIFFTSCGTEANNTALKCAVRDLGVKHIISSPIEHHAVLYSLDCLQEHHDVKVHYLNVSKTGEVDLDQLDQLLNSINDKCLVSLMHANNEIGTMLDLERATEICSKHDAYFHTDAVQTFAHYPIDVQKLKIHFLSASAHKFHGPKGVGLLYINGDVKIKPFLHGGSQERNMRAGTENIYGIIGFAKAFEIASEHMSEHRAHVEGLKSNLKNQLITFFPDVEFNGESGEKSLYTVLSVSFPKDFGSDLLLFNLDIEGISCSGGSACSSGTDAGSHVMKHLNADPSRKSVRFSFSRFNTNEDIDFLVSVLKKMVAVEV
ncbi:MAG: cysteine desulfurase [Chitinophagales bacterium]|nr:cysteine desulfurase [Chitinophagales bacterium]